MGILSGGRACDHQIEDWGLIVPVEQLAATQAHGPILGHIMDSPTAIMFLHHIRNRTTLEIGLDIVEIRSWKYPPSRTNR